MALESHANDVSKGAGRFNISRVVIGSLIVSSVLLFVFWVWSQGPPHDGKGRRAFFDATSLESAVLNFQSEYIKLPISRSVTDTATDPRLVKVLIGEDKNINPKEFKFLAIRLGHDKKGGLDITTSQVFDPWGSGFQVFLDTDGDKRITVTRGSKIEVLTDRSVTVFSPGADKIAGTSDDVITWQQ